MDTGQVITVVGFLVSIFTILFGIVALMWQINSQSSRLEAKIDEQGKEIREQGKYLEAKIDEQGKYLEAKIDEQGKEIREQGKYLEAKIDEQGKELRDEIKAQGSRVSQAELDQARINGVNSVLLRHIHTHETLGDAD